MPFVAFDTKEFGLQIMNPVGSVYVPVSGMQSLTWGEDRDDIETTSDGASYKTYIMGDRDVSVAFEGIRLTDPINNKRDPGQRLVEQAARKDGAAGIRTYRVVHLATATTNYIQLDGYTMNGEFGGGRNEATPWSMNVKPASTPTFVGAMFNPDDASYT